MELQLAVARPVGSGRLPTAGADSLRIKSPGLKGISQGLKEQIPHFLRSKLAGICSYGRVLPCLIFEDDHLLVVNKPPGLNTHAPSPYAGEGLYDWLRHREVRWAKLAIMQRLDKETSGVIVFAKTPLANRSLTVQFTERSVRKKYLLLTDRPVNPTEVTVKSTLVRAGNRYVSRPLHAGGDVAETHFRVQEAKAEGRSRKVEGGEEWVTMVEAEPFTGRTHQIRVHAAEKGFPILGDTLYGGTPARRVYLHAAELTLKHPALGQEMTFRAPLGTGRGGWPALADGSPALPDVARSADRTGAHGCVSGHSRRE